MLEDELKADWSGIRLGVGCIANSLLSLGNSLLPRNISLLI
jgi:hypothetical protein